MARNRSASSAGRNGKQAYSFLLANKNDIRKQQDLLKLRYPEIDEIKKCYQNLANFLQIAENTLWNTFMWMPMWKNWESSNNRPFLKISV